MVPKRYLPLLHLGSLNNILIRHKLVNTCYPAYFVVRVDIPFNRNLFNSQQSREKRLLGREKSIQAKQVESAGVLRHS